MIIYKRVAMDVPKGGMVRMQISKILDLLSIVELSWTACKSTEAGGVSVDSSLWPICGEKAIDMITHTIQKRHFEPCVP
jgi:hypothetical protein